ncbi:MAG: Gfo/Idh/MocA family oxidoreductase, partial [Chloroflexi bacterium]|nr:Gfo/Idh/MocA family oxidoreductase [Chloroflexota bacterium]
MQTDLRLAVLGCGAIARYHLDAIKGHVPRVRVTACVDNDADRAGQFATETGGTAFASLDAALDADAFDAIAILLPHDLHEVTTLQCLAAGKHVMLEKPMAPTL